MEIGFLFTSRGHSVTDVARAAGVSVPTASKWKSGKSRPALRAVVKLHSSGYLTDDDLRAAGLNVGEGRQLESA